MWKRITQCRVCKSTTKQIVNFGKVAFATCNNALSLAGRSFDTSSASLTLDYCENCTHLQLGEVVDPDVLYGMFKYQSSFTHGLLDHFESTYTLLKDYMPGICPTILEVGSNHGGFLEVCKRRGARIFGVEPSARLSADANAKGLNTFHCFFNAKTAVSIAQNIGRVDCLYIANTLANIDDLDDFFVGATTALADGAILAVDTQDGERVIDDCLIDTIYHEHLSYFTEHSLQHIARLHGFTPEKTIRHPSKGGAMICLFRHTRSDEAPWPRPAQFEARIGAFHQRCIAIQHRVKSRIDSAALCFAFGSSVGCAMLANFFGFDKRVVRTLDDNPQIDALLIPDGSIPVEHTRSIARYAPDTIILLSHRYEHLIRTSLINAGLPSLEVLFNPWQP